MDIESRPHLVVFDPLRGFLAFWVYAYHLMRLTTAKGYGGAIAVDIFMFVSGFLMFYIWNVKGSVQLNPRTIAGFYVRRSFRIAPLYFVSLVPALLFGHVLFGQIHALEVLYPPSWGVLPLRPDPTWWTALSHLSFVFGFLPWQAESTPLPDWSIGLEMQFYALFPLLLLVMRRVHPLILTAGVIFIVTITNQSFGLYLTPGRFGLFPQPSFLGFKLNIFMFGAFCCASLLARKTDEKLLFLICAALLGLNHPSLSFRAITCVSLVLLIASQTNQVPKSIWSILTSWPSKFLGNTSYGVYLMHMLVITPVTAALVSQQWFLAMDGPMRFAFALTVTAPLVYGFACLGFWFVEQPGIRVGHRLSTAIELNPRDEHASLIPGARPEV
jgi:peptidoglycan/LPS O-acetylase OafA/YrhL